MMSGGGIAGHRPAGDQPDEAGGDESGAGGKEVSGHRSIRSTESTC